MLKKLLHEKKILVLTGAGISAESGLPTYRDQNGLWADTDLAQLISASGIEFRLAEVNDFFNKLRQSMVSARPNPAHIALADAQKNNADNIQLITQNIDGLHSKAGFANVISMHGQIDRARCLSCGFVFKCTVDIDEEGACPQCEAQMTLRPDVVLFGESPMYMPKIEKLLNWCDVFIAIGTSGEVLPSADFVKKAKERPDVIAIQINSNSTKLDPYFDHNIIGAAANEVPKLLINAGVIINSA